MSPHFLYFKPLPHGHGSLRPTLTFVCGEAGWVFLPLVAVPSALARSLVEPLVV